MNITSDFTPSRLKQLAPEQARLRKIALKWARISKERAKEDSTLQQVSWKPGKNDQGDGCRYDLAVALKGAITISFDLQPAEVEGALATNAASLGTTTLLALLAAIVVDAPDGKIPKRR